MLLFIQNGDTLSFVFPFIKQETQHWKVEFFDGLFIHQWSKNAKAICF